MTESTTDNVNDSVPIRHLPLASGFLERVLILVLYVFTYLTLRPLLGPPWPATWQRRLMGPIGMGLPISPGMHISQTRLGSVPTEEITAPSQASQGTLLYLHGGAFVVGSPMSHRPLTTRLASETGARILVVDYRLEPEHRYPAALDDCLAAYQALLNAGVAPGSIVVAGDSAGGALSLMLALRLKRLGLPQPAGLLLISPVTGVALDSPSHERYRYSDPMLRSSCLAMVSEIMAVADEADERCPVRADLTGLPPMLIQVGAIEALHDDATELAAQAQRCGVAVELQICSGLWHVSQLYAGLLGSASQAVTQLSVRFRELIAAH